MATTSADPTVLFKNHLRKAGHSYTAQRQRILDEIAVTENHFDAEELIAILRRKKQTAGRATVYRTLRHLEECGLVRRIDFGEDHQHFEFTRQKQHHEHLCCSQCGTIIEFTDNLLEERLMAAARKNGFRITKHKVQVFGLCARCREKSERRRDA